MRNSFLKKLIANSLVLFAISFNGCGGGGNSNEPVSSANETNEESKSIISNYVLLGPIAEANVSIKIIDEDFDFNTTTSSFNQSITEYSWPDLPAGIFEIDFENFPVNSDGLVYIEVTNGYDVDVDDDLNIDSSFKNLKGIINGYVLLSDLKEGKVIVNALTTWAAHKVKELKLKNSTEIVNFLNAFAKDIFRLSVNEDDIIDYRDIYSYIPSNTENNFFKNPRLYIQLLENNFTQAILNDENLTEVLLSDVDGDNLTLEEELLIGTNPLNRDSDNDGLYDNIEIQNGLNPTISDTDYDFLSDYTEFYGETNATASDSDNDFIPDGVELLEGLDPLNQDEDNTGIVDGLEGDPLFYLQWHIDSRGLSVSNTKGVSTIIGNDLDILNVYHNFVGKHDGYETVIQVVDTGVEKDHEDLYVDLNRSFNSVTKTNDPTPTSNVSTIDKSSPLVVGHGTAVAGIIAARARNGKGVRGVVPYATIAGSNWLENQSLEDLEYLWYSADWANDILVSNNSWGAYFLNDKSFETILELATSDLRDKKGRIFTVPSGNDRENYGNANLSYLANNRYVITVAALNHENKFASYSNPGSNILVSAYGGEYYYIAPTIATTLLMGRSYYESELNGEIGAITVDEDTGRNYTFAMNGTSAATPMVSGVIALVLEACPDLTWRDVKWLIASTAKKIDENDSHWIQNDAGLWHNINYGFGLINPSKMIEKCKSPYYELLPEEINASITLSNLEISIPDNNTTISKSVYFKDNFVTEWVGLTIDTDHTYSGDLEIALTSPSGTRTLIITPNEINYDGYNGGFRFSSLAFMGEKSEGYWKVEITDRLEGDSGTLNSITLEIFGHKE
ncbi:S8 family serine peptidase [Nitrosophilus labii]|uniref:S8 family serine peptidase n=1 Tax=Nitrosophilus labii TaxID=2706014 RepID=UPI001656DD5F|nr:S8 family serine peptidase [Nitrosophilus labii]